MYINHNDTVMKEFRSSRLRVWENISLTIREFKVLLLGYRSYTALLNQSGTNPPVATVLENTLGFDVVWYYETVGFYLCQNNSTGILFNPDKTWINTTADHTYSNNDTPGIYRGPETPVPSIGILTSTDDALINYSIEIRVYN